MSINYKITHRVFMSDKRFAFIRDLKISDGDVNENVISKYNFALS